MQRVVGLYPHFCGEIEGIESFAINTGTSFEVCSCNSFRHSQHDLFYGREQDSGADKTLWSENQVKTYLGDFATRKNIALEPRKAWRGTGDDLARESVAGLCLLFVGSDQRMGLELYYEIHPSEVLLLFSIAYFFC